MFNVSFDFDEAKKGNTLITGSNQIGKSRLACGIASMLQSRQWQVIAFDNSGKWKEASDIPNRFKIYPRADKLPPIPIDTSMVYDTSLLTPNDSKYIVNYILQSLWEYRVINQVDSWLMVILEELQLFAKNVRGIVNQNLLRVMSVGANQKMRCIGIVFDLAMVDPCYIRLCTQRFHGRLPIEENSKRKFKSYYGSDMFEVASHLGVGTFIYYHIDKLRIIQAPLFEPHKTPQLLTIKQPSIIERLKTRLSS